MLTLLGDIWLLRKSSLIFSVISILPQSRGPNMRDFLRPVKKSLPVGVKDKGAFSTFLFFAPLLILTLKISVENMDYGKLSSLWLDNFLISLTKEVPAGKQNQRLTIPLASFSRICLHLLPSIPQGRREFRMILPVVRTHIRYRDQFVFRQHRGERVFFPFLRGCFCCVSFFFVIKLIMKKKGCGCANMLLRLSVNL